LEENLGPIPVIMMGATGAVGGHVVAALQALPQLGKLTILGRRLLPGPFAPAIKQEIVDVLDPWSYRHLVTGHEIAICTLGVGQPSKVSEAEFVKIDRDAVIAFATACKQSGVKHFELLGAVAADSKSRSFYLRTKGELQDALVALNFERLSVFQPSMILTPTNRYGAAQGILLAIWPIVSVLFVGPLRKYRGIPVATLGTAIAANLFTQGPGVEILQWPDFVALAAPIIAKR
jgi:uncharacterized protein YbjT (DUF2867 family)